MKSILVGFFTKSSVSRRVPDLLLQKRNLPATSSHPPSVIKNPTPSSSRAHKSPIPFRHHARLSCACRPGGCHPKGRHLLLRHLHRCPIEEHSQRAGNPSRRPDQLVQHVSLFDRRRPDESENNMGSVSDSSGSASQVERKGIRRDALMMLIAAVFRRR